MSYKLSFILSMIFVVTFFLFAGDLICLQYVYSDLDAKSITISYLISAHGGLDHHFIQDIEEKYKVDFVTADNYSPLFGDEVTYVIAKLYQPMVISQKKMTISIKRTTVIGYYH